MLMIYLDSESKTYGIEKKKVASRTILILDTKAVD